MAEDTARRKRKGTAPGAPAAQARAFGRSFADFGEFNDAEKELIAAAHEGWVAWFGTKVPETNDEKKTRTIRADLVRFLALGGCRLN